MALIIKVLLENRLGKGQDSLLQAKPGLSLLVEDETSRVLHEGIGNQDPERRQITADGHDPDTGTMELW